MIDRSPKGLKQALQTKSFNLARRKMQRAATTVKKAGRPNDGIWYWVPSPSGQWNLLTWEGDTAYHAEVWPIVARFHLAKAYGLNEEQIKAVAELPYSVPRGRVTMESDGKVKYFFVRHGGDTPVGDAGLKEVLDKFNLVAHSVNGLAELIRDPHETMVNEQRAALLVILGPR